MGRSILIIEDSFERNWLKLSIKYTAREDFVRFLPQYLEKNRRTQAQNETDEMAKKSSGGFSMFKIILEHKMELFGQSKDQFFYVLFEKGKHKLIKNHA